MTSPKAALQNLQKIGQLSPEPASKSEFNGLVLSGDQMLPDAETASLFPIGDYFSDEQLIKELIALAKELQAAVKALGPIQS